MFDHLLLPARHSPGDCRSEYNHSAQPVQGNSAFKVIYSPDGVGRSLEFHFWLDEAAHTAANPDRHIWRAVAIANAIGWGSRV